MNCANCGKIIIEENVQEDGYSFCNSICRYTWRENGKPNPYTSIDDASLHKILTDFNLDYQVEPPGFEDRGMHIRLSYWRAPKLFIDNKEIKPVKKNIFYRNRKFLALSNFGNTVSIKLIHRPLDLIPKLQIERQKFEIGRPLNKWEYVWICLPLILVLIGGAIGGILGSIAVYSNSILIRKPRNVFLKIFFTGATTIASFWFFIQFVGFALPFTQYFTPPKSVDEQLKMISAQVNKQCPILIDNETRLDSTVSGSDKMMIYYYTLTQQLKTNINIDEAREFLTYQIINYIRTKDEMRFMRENDVTFRYKYKDKAFVDVLDIVITESDYD
ncbi:MAG: hypothetical protein U5J96_01150 [Ignavibacteriaceae bacterium]|nr:hypothetical protein [Ignavibacteriaceae bacterium]